MPNGLQLTGPFIIIYVVSAKSYLLAEPTSFDVWIIEEDEGPWVLAEGLVPLIPVESPVVDSLAPNACLFTPNIFGGTGDIIYLHWFSSS